MILNDVVEQGTDGVENANVNAVRNKKQRVTIVHHKLLDGGNKAFILYL